MAYTGRCSCGEVRYRISRAPIFTHACHCRLCQRSTASAFILHSFIEADHFHLEQGQLKPWDGATGSGKGQKIWRCAHCSDQIFSIYHGKDKRLLLKTASLDDAERFPPEAHIFIARKLDWVTLDDRVPQFDRAYDRQTLFSAESLQRFTALD